MTDQALAGIADKNIDISLILFELCSFLVYELSSEVVHPVLCLCVL